MFARSREATAIGDTDSGRIVQWNPAAERLLGWSAAEAVGQTIDALISPAIVPLHRATMALARDGGPPADRPLDLLLVCRDGEQVHVELTLVPLEFPPAPARFVLLLLHDTAGRPAGVANQVRLTNLKAQCDAAEQTVREQQLVFKSGLSELQREVRRLHHSARHVLRRVETPDLGRVAVSAHATRVRLLRLDHDLELLAVRTAVAANALELRCERTNLVPLIGRVVRGARAQASTYRIKLAAPQGLTATVDPLRFAQVVELLVEHAMARCRGGCWIDVDLRRPLAGQACLEVRAFGRSLADADRRYLANGGRDNPALALARSIVELHAGTLEFEFPAHGGVRAVVTLPTQRGRVLARR
jgi:PAS domain S-box-containing protein